ncbi:MAG: pyridoxal-phosphate dependent enzyme [Chloroflexi bacterium]|nr:pyridoxal-phosphate dependent enzyme [Chloroflexota bacterium]
MENNGFNHNLKVYSDITQLIASLENPTPLVRVNRLNSNKDFPLYLKLERYNPFGSVKDRIALEMLRGLELKGRTIVEPSSGNTGIAIASIANAWGVPVEIAVPERIPEEKKVMLRLLGATVTEADDALCPLFPTEGARGLVNALVKSPATKDKYVSPNQYENELNLQAHYRGTGPEIWRQTEGKVTHFFAGFGTCGTITGVGRYLKEQNPSIKIIGVEPSSADHRLPGLKRITGLAEEYIPKILDRSVIDETVAVDDDDAYRAAIGIARKEGIPVGPTTGAILAAALKHARTGKGLAVVISPDDAFKYTSFYQQFLEKEPEVVSVEEYDLCGYICPISKVKAIEVIENMGERKSARLLLGDINSLKNVAQELKARGIKATFEQAEDSKFVMTFTK